MVAEKEEGMALLQLIYFSAGVGTLSDQVLDRILESSVRHNEKNGVTGLLVYAEGNFMQVLEGEAAAVEETYARIAQDPRHHQLYLLWRESIPARQFGQWSMAFRRLSPRDGIECPAYAPLFSHGFDAAALGEAQGLALEMLLHFANQHKVR